MAPRFCGQINGLKKNQKGLALIEKALIELEDGHLPIGALLLRKADAVLDRPLLTAPILACCVSRQSSTSTEVLADVAQSSKLGLLAFKEGCWMGAPVEPDDQSAPGWPISIYSRRPIKGIA